jgi:hypothetical protein
MQPLFELKTIKLSELENNTGQIKGLPENPRFIKDEKFKLLVENVRKHIAMLQLRELIVYPNGKKFVVVAGNMRLRALRELKEKTVLCKVLNIETPPEKLIAYALLDNNNFGQYDFDMLANNFDLPTLQELGVDLPVFDLQDTEYGENFELPEGDKTPFQQMTFTLADKQADFLKNAISDIKKTEDFKYCETFGNENSNGNALYLILMQWAGQKK